MAITKQKNLPENKRLDFMTFFGNFPSAKEDLMKVFNEITKENGTTSIFAAKPEQIERVRQVLIDVVIKKDEIISQLPRTFLNEHFLKFTPEQMQAVTELAKKATKENGNDDYRTFTDEQQLEGRLLIEGFVRDNLNSFLEELDNKKKVPTLEKINTGIDSIKKQTSDFRQYLSDQISVFSSICNEIMCRYDEISIPVNKINTDEIISQQSAQILALTSELSILKSINETVMAKLNIMQDALNEEKQKNLEFKKNIMKISETL